MNLPLSLIGETATTVTLGWTPPVGARGYIFTTGSKRSSTIDGTRAKVTLAKPGPYSVEALGTVAVGAYPAPVVIVTVDQLQAAINAAKDGDRILVEPGRCRKMITTGTKRIQVCGVDPNNPPVFVADGKRGLYAIYSEGAATIGPDLIVSNPTGSGVGVRANDVDIGGGRVTGVTFAHNGMQGLYQGTQPGRTHIGFRFDHCAFFSNGEDVTLDPHSPPGDGLHHSYVGGGQGVTRNLHMHDCESDLIRTGQAHQFGGSLQGALVERVTGKRVRRYSGHSASSYAVFGIFSSYGGTSGVVFDDCHAIDCDGYGFKAVGGAKGTVKNSTAEACALGPSLALTNGGGNSW